MAKKAAKQASKSIDALAASFRTTHGGFTVKEIEQAVRCIYAESYAQRFVRDSSGYILGHFELHVGKPSTGKTSALMQIGRVFLDAGGVFFLVDTEGKCTPAHIRAVLGDRADSPRFIFIRASTVGDAGKDKKKKEKKTKTEEEIDEEVARETGWFTQIANALAWSKNNAPDVPVLIALDTITSAPTEEHMREFSANEGVMKAASTKQLRRASVIKSWLESICAELTGTNILFAATNHVRDDINLDGGTTYGAQETKWSGGAALEQRAAVIVEYHKSTARDDSVETSTNAVRITVRKNSNGTANRKLQVPFDYRHLLDESGRPVLSATGEKVRIVNWQWDKATVNLLSSFFNPDHRPEWERQGPEKYRKIIRMDVKGQNPNKRYSMRAVKEDEYGEPTSEVAWEVHDLTEQELADFIESSAEAQMSLQNMLLTGIVNHTVYSYLEDDDPTTPTEKEISENGNTEQGSETVE